MRFLPACLVLLALLALVALPARAQEGPVITARPLGPELTLRPGQEGQLKLELTIRPGYHINSNQAPDEMTIPTRLTAAPQQGLSLLKVDYPPAVSRSFSFSDKPLPVFDGAVTLALTLRAGPQAPPGRRRFRAVLHYQACTGESCLLPEEMEIAIPLTVSGP